MGTKCISIADTLQTLTARTSVYVLVRLCSGTAQCFKIVAAVCPALWAQACVLVTFALNGTPYPSGLLGLYSLGIVEYCGYLVVENLLALAPPLLGADTSCLAL